MSVFGKPTEEQIRGNIEKVKKALGQLYDGLILNLSDEEFNKIEKDLKQVLSYHETSLEELLKQKLD